MARKKSMSLEMTTTNKSPEDKGTRRGYGNLEAKYGEVGISAVAAAMRYQNDLHESQEITPPRYRRIERD
jgi:hypothetical protein